jgi:hypothetical protein
MSVMVYSRLGDMLRDRNMSVGDRARRIADRFGLEVDERSLDRLTHTARVRRPDIELAGAAAAVLDVGLDDVFTVAAIPVDADGTSTEPAAAEEDSILTPEQSHRLRSLYERQGQRALTEDEWAELDELVATYGRLFYAQGVRDIAAQRGLPVEQVQADLAADLERVLAWRRELEADPARKEALVEEARERQQTRAVS